MSLQSAQSLLFSQSRPEVPPGLSGRVVAAIEFEAIRRLRFRLRVASTCSFLSIILFFVNLTLVGEGFLTSDFWRLTALLFSDLSLVLTNLEAFLFSLAETFPAASASLLLLPVFLSIVALLFRSRYAGADRLLQPLQLNPIH